VLKNVAPGWHCCQFYRDFDDLLDIVAPYMADGLKNDEGCFWVLPEVVAHKAACDAIARYVENVEAYLASGQLELMSHSDWYFDPMASASKTSARPCSPNKTAP
jgi:hypothetical protein